MWSCGLRPRLVWVEMAVGPSESPSYAGHSPHINRFSPCCLLNDRKKAAHSLFKSGRLFSLFCFFLSCFLILLLLMSSNFHPNPCPVFSCSVCDRYVTWRGRSLQCCTCPRWVRLRCLLLSFFRFKTLASSYSWSWPLCCNLYSSGDPTLTESVLLSRTPPACILHCAIWPSLC